MVKEYKEIDELMKDLNSIRKISKPMMDIINEGFNINFTYNSNAIEGNSYTYSETEFLLKENVTINGKSIKDTFDVINHKKAYDYILKEIKNKSELSEELILKTHSIVLQNEPELIGKYRELEVVIRNAVEVKHETPSYVMVPGLMKKFVDKYNSMENCHPIEKCAVMHAEFEHIHPFPDGNGRTGRLLLNFELMKNGYLPIDIKYQNRFDYYENLQEYHEKGNCKNLIDMVAHYQKCEIKNRMNLFLEPSKKKAINWLWKFENRVI